MARKAKAKPSVQPQAGEPENVQATPEATGAPVASAEETKALRRMSFPISENGDILWDSMRPSTQAELKDLFRKCLQDATFAASVGGEPLPVVEIFDAEWTGTIFDVIGAIESMLAQRVYGVPPEIARDCFTYNEAEKKILAKPAAKVINKYASQYDWMVRFKEEIALGMLVFSMSSVKLSIAKARAKQFEAERKSRANGAEKQPAQVIESAEAVPVQ